jgi:hypothetical protein
LDHAVQVQRVEGTLKALAADLQAMEAAAASFPALLEQAASAEQLGEVRGKLEAQQRFLAAWEEKVGAVRLRFLP